MKIEFERETGYKKDETNPNITTYWHIYAAVSEVEYYKHYCEWLEDNCVILTQEQAEDIFWYMPDWIKEQPEGLNPQFYGTGSAGGDREQMFKIKSILKL